MTDRTSNPTASSYAESGFGRRIGWGKRPALLLIDVCVAYWTTGSPLDLSANPEALKVPQSIRDLLTAARQSGVPVLWTAVQYAQNGEMRDAGLFWHKNKVLDVWKVGDERKLYEWVEGLEPNSNEP
jgi:nicotinamidase-related amidase